MIRWAVFVALCATAATAAPERSVSTSRQFVVYGGDIRLRGAICDVAEQTKQNVLTLIAERDEWRVPIIINAELPQANFPEAPATHLQLAQSEAGLKLQLDLVIGADIQAAVVEREVLRALLLEMIFRDAGPLRPGTKYAEPPQWLVEGIVARERTRETAAQLLEPVVTAGKAIPLAVFLQQRPEMLDAVSVELYRAYSAALLDLLLRGNDSHRQLGQFIRDLRQGSIDPVADLAIHFSQLNGMSGIANAWSEQLARIVAGERYQLGAVAETARTLDEMLHVKIGETNYGIDEFARILHERGSRPVLRYLSEQLLLFEPRANPVYREIVIEYQEIATLLARGSTKRVAERLARAKEWRHQLAMRMSRIDDYLNWFEATQQSARSGIFDDYLKAAATKSDLSGRRRDRISVYLDAVETQLE
ncbi:MAG: hypothetical protein ACJ8JD_13025 [Chthoniobacterales bacterium]